MSVEASSTPTLTSSVGMTTTSPVVSPTTVPMATIKHSADFDNGKFRVSWVFDSNEDKVRFRLEVQAQGWIGFGFSKKAPQSMKDYDIIIGGALDAGGGYLYVSTIFCPTVGYKLKYGVM